MYVYFSLLDLLAISGEEDEDVVEDDVEDDDDLALLALLTFEYLLQNIKCNLLKSNSTLQ